jgi:hypothetical protein
MDEARSGDGLSRRQLLQRAGAGAAVAWAAPAIVTKGVSAFAQQGSNAPPTEGVIVDCDDAWKYQEFASNTHPSYPSDADFSGSPNANGPWGDYGCSPCGDPVGPWTGNADLGLERKIHVSSGPVDLKFEWWVDDGADFFIDGTRVGGNYGAANSCTFFTFTTLGVSSGDHVVNCRVENFGGDGHAFAVRITAV